MAIGDITRMTATFQGLNGQIYQWVWHYSQATGGAISFSALATAAKAQLAASWAEIEDFISTGVVGDTLLVAYLNPITLEFDGRATIDISEIAGVGAADGFPSNVSPYVTFFTAVARSIGKKFLFGVLESAVANGALLPGLVAAMALFLATFDNTVTEGSNTWKPGNYRFSDNSFRGWTQTSGGVGAFSGSQYRRLPGRGI